MNTTVPQTKYGAELLKQERHQLKTKERRSVIDAISEARSHAPAPKVREAAAQAKTSGRRGRNRMA